jgi:hypothetical protein
MVTTLAHGPEFIPDIRLAGSYYTGGLEVSAWPAQRANRATVDKKSQNW